MTIFRKNENQNQREYVNVTKMVLRAKVYPIGQIMLLCKCTSLCLFDNHVELNRWLKMHWMGFVIDDRREWNDKCFTVLKLCQTILWKTMCLLLFLFCFGSFPDPSVKFASKKSIVFGFFTVDVFLDFLFHLFRIQTFLIMFFSCFFFWRKATVNTYSTVFEIVHCRICVYIKLLFRYLEPVIQQKQDYNILDGCGVIPNMYTYKRCSNEK